MPRSSRGPLESWQVIQRQNGRLLTGSSQVRSLPCQPPSEQANNKMTFTKGKSGNPGGRPKKDPEFQKALKKLEPSALATIKEAISGPDGTAALQAAKFVIEQLHGKAPQAMEVSGPEGGPVPLSSEFIDRPPRETFEEWEARRKKELEQKK